MSVVDPQEFGKLQAQVEHMSSTLDELAPIIRSAASKLERQSGFVTGVAATVSAIWALVLLVVGFVLKRDAS